MPFSFSTTWEYFPLFGQPSLTSSDSISDNVVVKLYPHWYNHVTAEWTIPPSWGNCRFNVYRSEVEDGSFIKINSTPLSGNYLKDNTSDYSKYHNTWYIVEAVLPSGQRVQSRATSWIQRRSTWVQLRANEINRREWLLLNKFTGVESYAIRRRTYGKRCTECWNEDLKKVMKDKCNTCMGTSFEGGYFPAVVTRVQYDPSPNDLEYTYFGKMETNEFPAWTIAFPRLYPRDLVYRVSDAGLFVVMDWNNTELQTETVRQILLLSELDKESVEYQVVVKNNIIPQAYQ